MKSGLYACAGASATASAAAWAKRFDEPITNESKVYFVLKPPLSGRFCCGWMRATQRDEDVGPPSRSSSRSAGSSARRALGDAQLERAAPGR